MRTLLLILSLLSATTTAPLRIDVFPLRQIAPLRGTSTVRVRIIVERDPRNRAVAWAWESDGASGRSVKQIDGEQSQRVWTVFIDHLLPGRYSFNAILARSDGSEVSKTTEFEILSGDDPQ